MAKFSAISEVDIVGSMESFTFPPISVPVPGSTTAFFLGYTPPVPPLHYYIFNVDTAGFPPTANVTSFAQFKPPMPPVPAAVGAGDVNHAWKADPGDSYLLGMQGTPNPDTLHGLMGSAKPGDPTKTFGTEQQINQFFFKFDDKIHGSHEDDMLCGWAGKDKVWGNEGDGEFYYGEGMGKDKFMDVNKKKDEIILDTDLVKNFKKMKSDVKLKNDKVVIDFVSSDKLVIFGIDRLKELKKVVSFDDFTDFA